MKVHFIFLTLFFIFGCGSSPYKKGTEDPYISALDDAFDLMDQRKEGKRRDIASIEPSEDFLKKSIAFDAQKLKAFQMLVFPSNMNFNKKRELINNEKNEYGAPVVFNFKTVLSGNCNYLKKLNKFNSKGFFKAGKFKSGKKCFVIEGRRQRPKKWGKMVTRLNKDDTLAIRIFIDEDFRPFGKSIDLALDKGRKFYRTVNLLMNHNDSLSSELSMFPIDLPNLKDPAIGQSINFKSNAAVRIPKDFYVISQVKKRVKKRICRSGYQIDFKDFLGNTVMVDFCKGQSWPFTIHTDKFFAILI